MSAACAGLRVVEVGRGMAGALATMILADYGAEVVRVEPPGGDPLWDESVAHLIHRGKQSVSFALDTDAGRLEALGLVRTADVVVESLRPGEAGRLGLGDDVLSEANPSLVRCAISAFGSRGPLADVEGDDGLVMATAGVFRDQPGRHRGEGRPVFRNTREPSYAAAMLAVEGVLATLRAREVTGEGQRIETSLLQALVWRLNPLVRVLLPDGEDPPLGGGFDIPVPSGPTPPGAQMTGPLLQAADGRWIVHMLFERDFFPNWVHVLGLDWIWQDERFEGAPHKIADPEARVALAELFAQRMKEKTAAEWMDLYVANGNVCADVVQTTQEALRHPQVVEGGGVVEVDDPCVGPIVELGPLAMIPGAPAQVRGPAPTPGGDTDAIRRTELVAAPERSATGASLAGPLDGVTVVDASIFYATGAGSAQLADLGARVIKVEPVTGDPYRRAASGMGADNLVRSVQGKQDLALDLKDERGREIIHRLVSRADAFMHNFRLGVPERLGVDRDTLLQLNPRLVYLYGGAYGSTGPYRRQPAIDHIIAAFAGTTANQAGEGDEPMKEQGADPVASLGVAVALLLALQARDRTGKGQYVESRMIQSNLYMNAEDALSYEGKPPRRRADRLQRGLGALHRLYETAPPGPDHHVDPWQDPSSRWVFLSAEDDDQFVRLCAAVGRPDLAAVERFAHSLGRGEHRDALEAELEELFRTRPAAEWERDLLSAGVGCVVADDMSFYAFLHRHPQARALGMAAPAEHPSLGGTYWRPAPALDMSATPGRAGPYCEIGEDTRAILRELGYDDAAVAELEADGVVAWPDAREVSAS